MAVSLDTIIKLPTSHKIGILAVISVVIIGVYWFGPHRTKMKIISAKESKLSELTFKLKEQENIAKNYDKFVKETAMLKEGLARDLAKLPDKKEIPELLKNISNMSKEAGLEVLLFKPQGEQPAQFYARVPVELKFIGSYHKIGTFFSYVSTLPRIVNIENFSIQNAKKKGSDEFLLSTSCVATTYRYRDSVPPPQKGK